MTIVTKSTAMNQALLLLLTHGMKKVPVSIAGASSVIHGYAPEASIAVKIATEPIATKHGIVLIAVTV